LVGHRQGACFSENPFGDSDEFFFGRWARVDAEKIPRGRVSPSAKQERQRAQAVDETNSGISDRNETLQLIYAHIECGEEVLAGNVTQDFLVLVGRIDDGS